MPTLVKDQFRNDSGGVAGVIILENGQAKAIPVQPDDTVWLSEEEQAMTANAPRREHDNPFINGTLTLVTEAKEIRHARPLRPTDVEPAEEEVGAPPAPAGPPPTGQRQPTEEVATPDAVPAVETEVAHDGKTIVKKTDAPEPPPKAQTPRAKPTS